MEAGEREFVSSGDGQRARSGRNGPISRLQPPRHPSAPSDHGPAPAIDMCGIYFDGDGWEAYLRLFADRAPGYLRVFANPLVERAQVPVEDYLSALSGDPHDAVDVLLGGRPFDPPIAEHVAALRATGVVRQVLHGISRGLPDGTNINTRLARLASQHPDVLEVWAGLDLADIDAAIDELERCTIGLNLRGASIVHWWSERNPRDPGCHAVYARAAELGVPVWMHTGTSYASNHPFNYCSWADIDHIAVTHPQLTIIAGHGGWPWVLEGMAVLQRHPNVYLDFSAHQPRYMGRQGSGWEPMLHYGRSVVRDKILFGSVTWVHATPIPQLIHDVQALGLGEEVSRAWLHDNARRLLETRVALSRLGTPQHDIAPARAIESWRRSDG